MSLILIFHPPLVGFIPPAADMNPCFGFHLCCKEDHEDPDCPAVIGKMGQFSRPNDFHQKLQGKKSDDTGDTGSHKGNPDSGTDRFLGTPEGSPQESPESKEGRRTFRPGPVQTQEIIRGNGGSRSRDPGNDGNPLGDPDQQGVEPAHLPDVFPFLFTHRVSQRIRPVTRSIIPTKRG